MPATPIKSIDVNVETTQTITVTETTTYETEAVCGLRYAVLYLWSAQTMKWEHAKIVAMFGSEYWADSFIVKAADLRHNMRILDTVTGKLTEAGPA